MTTSDKFNDPTSIFSIYQHRNWRYLLGPLTRNFDKSYGGVYKGRRFRVWTEPDERGRPVWRGNWGSIRVQAASFHGTRSSIIWSLRIQIDEALRTRPVEHFFQGLSRSDARPA